MALDMDTLTVTGARDHQTIVTVYVDGIDRDESTGMVTLRISGEEEQTGDFAPILEDYYIDIFVNGTLEKEERQGTAGPPSDVSVAADPGDDIRVTITVNEGWTDIDPAELNVTAPDIELSTDDVTILECSTDPEGTVTVERTDDGTGERLWVTVSGEARNDASVAAVVRIAITVDGQVRTSDKELFTDTQTLQPGESSIFETEISVVLREDEQLRTHEFGLVAESVTAA